MISSTVMSLVITRLRATDSSLSRVDHDRSDRVEAIVAPDAAAVFALAQRSRELTEVKYEKRMMSAAALEAWVVSYPMEYRRRS
jgi:hypothetical protein